MAIYQESIASLKALATPTVTDIYYTDDIGQEGNWYYDTSITLADENIGTILFSSGTGTGGYRRIYDPGFVNAVWFYNSLTDTDATPYIQRALDCISNTSYASVVGYSSGGGTVFLPKGVYLISATLKIGQHCKLLGVAKSATEYNNATSGSILLVNPNTVPTFDMWAIESATYSTSLPLNPLIGYKRCVADGNDYTHTHGIIIEQITIYANGIYGGLRLTNSPYSVIRNVSVYDAKIGIYLNNCWNCAIEDSYVRRVDWYGIVLAETNVCAIKDTAVSGKAEYNTEGNYFITFGEGKPDFIPDFTDSGLDNIVETGRTGIYICKNGNANEINNCSSEIFTNGIVSLEYCNTNINTAYVENIGYYGIVTGIGESLAVMNTIYFEAINAKGTLTNSYPFYFGSGSSVTISAVNCMRYSPPSVGDLFKVDVDDVYVTFSNTKYKTRKYNKHVFFLDETPYGANFGSVYIDSVSGNDLNYGFNENDALQTFDAALDRVQNQSTINPVRRIYLKRDTTITKSTSIAGIENADILISSYGSGINNPMLQYQVTSGNASVGYIMLFANVKLTFLDIDIEVNNSSISPTSSQPADVALFCLANNYNQINFDNTNINLQVDYTLVSTQAPSNRSFFETRMANTNIYNFIDPFGTNKALLCNAQGLMAITCLQFNSTITPDMASKINRGWDAGVIIYNNL